MNFALQIPVYKICFLPHPFYPLNLRTASPDKPVCHQFLNRRRYRRLIFPVSNAKPLVRRLQNCHPCTPCAYKAVDNPWKQVLCLDVAFLQAV